MNKESTLLFLGDVVPYKPFKFKNSFKTVINLECPIIKNGSPVKGKINLRVKENYLAGIFKDKLLVANLGNNHILDFGSDGLYSTLEELQKLKIKYFGVNDENGKYSPLIIDFYKTRIAFISAVCQSTSPLTEIDNVIYLNLLNIDEIISRVTQIRKLVHRVVVYIHWGIEESSYPAKVDIFSARKMIDAGVDIIIGSHAHAPQAVEKYKNGIIAYNLGNFIMPRLKNYSSYFDERGIPQSEFSKRLMPWNRISWGLIINMETLEYRIKNFMFIFDRIIELPITAFDKFKKLHFNSWDSYDLILAKHLERREFFNKVIDFINRPHIPQKLTKLLWK